VTLEDVSAFLQNPFFTGVILPFLAAVIGVLCKALVNYAIGTELVVSAFIAVAVLITQASRTLQVQLAQHPSQEVQEKLHNKFENLVGVAGYATVALLMILLVLLAYEKKFGRIIRNQADTHRLIKYFLVSVFLRYWGAWLWLWYSCS
jgi:hypothetical protein